MIFLSLNDTFSQPENSSHCKVTKLPSTGAMPQIIRVKQRAVDAHVVADLVDGTFDVLPPGVHRQQRVTHADRIIQTTAGNAALWSRVIHYKKTL